MEASKLWPLFGAFILATLVAVTVGSAGKATEAAAPLDAEEQALLTLINKYRETNGLSPLSLNAELSAAAEWMSNDMATNDYFGHTDSLGRDPFARMLAFGYNHKTWRAENLAAGSGLAQWAFNAWEGSAGHNANMLNPNAATVGIARAHNPDSALGWYWTAKFGAEGSAPPSDTLPPTPAKSPTPKPTEPQAAPEPALPPTSEPTPEPTLQPTPEPTPEPTPVPTPETPTIDAIQHTLSGPWSEVSVMQLQRSVLPMISYYAERYMTAQNERPFVESGAAGRPLP